jgi:hypothetical protein
MTAAVKPFLDTAGKFTVEKIPCPHFNINVDLDAPRTGVLHTTEGDWTSSLAVFKTHFAPHFLLGLDATQNKVRIAQLVQIGTIGAALVTHNDHAIVQIEMIGFSKQTLWLPDPETLEALASLMAVCQREYGIALTHPWADGDYGVYGNNPHRGSGKWGVVGGWYAHGDVPSPDVHWDVGALEWSKVLAAAAAMNDIVTAPAWAPPAEPPRPCATDDPKGTTMTAASPPAAPVAASPPPFTIPAWPPASNPMWNRVAQMVNALRAKGAANPFVVATITNGYAESDETPKIEGDSDHAFSIFQWWWSPRGALIFEKTGIDIRTETSISKIIDAFWWELTNVYPKTFAEMKAATTAADATRAFCVEYEGAGAPNAADRRVMMSDYLSVWVAQNEPFIAANPAQ